MGSASLFICSVQNILMAGKPVPADEAEFRKSFGKLKERLDSLRNEIRRRRNKNVLWKF
jgi:hypothetical protein